MKKRNVLALFLIPTLLLVSCSNNDDEWEDEDTIKLKEDKSKDYNFDTTVTNENGSMSYEVFVRSFYDSNNDGIGDLNGLKQKLSYLKDLGIKTVWMMPINPSPSYHGYNVSDYYAINSDYGTMADFDALVSEANRLNIDLMMDMVLNHSSTENSWFKESYSDYLAGKTGDDSKADWYNWSTTSGHRYGELYYEGSFDSTMPDFNLDSETLRVELEKMVKFWIQKGVKGFRLDATTYYYSNDVTRNCNFLRWLNSTCKKYNPDFYMVGECWLGDGEVLSYYNSGINSFFKFGSAMGGTTGEAQLINTAKGNGKCSNFASSIEKYEANVKRANPSAYSSYFLSNHDQDRVSKNFTDERCKSAASLYCLMPGTPFMYYGEEIELKGVRKTSPDDYSDVRRRLPMIWSESDKTGQCDFPEKDRQDLNNNEQVSLGVNDKLNEPFSLLNHYKKVINIRNKYDVFKNGVFTSLVSELETDKNNVLAYKISDGDDYVIVVTNFGGTNVEVTAPGSEIVDTINTSHQIPELKDGKLKLGYYSTVIMK